LDAPLRSADDAHGDRFAFLMAFSCADNFTRLVKGGLHGVNALWGERLERADGDYCFHMA
jgi:hypothetical protein